MQCHSPIGTFLHLYLNVGMANPIIDAAISPAFCPLSCILIFVSTWDALYSNKSRGCELFSWGDFAAIELFEQHALTTAECLGGEGGPPAGHLSVRAYECDLLPTCRRRDDLQ